MTEALGGANPANLFGEAADELPTSAARFPWFQHRMEELRPSFPNHELVKLLGCGGMGAGVFLAKDLTTFEEVAIKVLPEDIGSNAQLAQWFKREAAAMETVKHPHIVTIRGFGQSNAEDLYIVMDYVEGQTLNQRISEKALPVDVALRIIQQVCSAIEHAHGVGFIHRDIKPANILIDESGHVSVSDFGLAQWSRATSMHRQTGIAGTYGYMAPEQLVGEGKVDHRTDVYSIGVVLYQMLTGVLPMGSYEPPSHTSPAAKGLDAIVAKALRPDPERRYQTVKELRAALDRIADVSGRRSWWKRLFR